MVRRCDWMETAIESALQPGRFIAWNQESAFVAGLEEVEREIAALADNDPVRVIRLYEAFIAACYLKADEIDSEWEFGHFIAELASAWIRARRASGTDHRETAKTLLSWVDRDDYGFFNHLGSDAVKVLDADGLAALEKEVEDRFERARRNQNDQCASYSGDHWAQTLKSIYVQQGRVEEYLAVAERTGLTPRDCSAVALILEAKRKLDDALIWIERGIAMEGSQHSPAHAGNNLAGMRRALLKKLRRGQDALDSAWAEFEKHPGTFAYEELVRYVPKPDRSAWQERAMATAERGDLEPFIELCVKAKEADRLAKRLECASDRELEGLGHYVTEPAATAVARTHPTVAAKVFRALGIRTLKAAKSKYYAAALAHLEQARRCYLAAGLEQQWEALALEIRRDHYRNPASCRVSTRLSQANERACSPLSSIEPAGTGRASGNSDHALRICAELLYFRWSLLRAKVSLFLGIDNHWRGGHPASRGVRLIDARSFRYVNGRLARLPIPHCFDSVNAAT